ncbi:hypothetical protein [Priestia megaterium]|uniref:hypothetical protein n=1 Tax=Priestia megaterium TaxID=1404 RepID=UPI0039FC14D0
MKWGKKLIIFIHIPKIGGTTLNEIFKRSYAENEIYDHVPVEVMNEHFIYTNSRELVYLLYLV